MPALVLDPATRRAQRAKAHHLHPVVTIGHQGLTAAVLHELEVALRAHELVKVRVLGDDRDARAILLQQVCETLGAAPVQHVGKVLVVWRPGADAADTSGRAVSRPGARQSTARKAGAAKGTKGGRVATAPAGRAKVRGSAASRGSKGQAAGHAAKGHRTPKDIRGQPPAPGSRGRTGTTASARSPGATPRARETLAGTRAADPTVGQATRTAAPSGVPRAGLPRRRRARG
jgi:putative YhbY family RNA-binding protein